VVRIGAALTGAILSAVGISIGVIVPMVFKGSGSFGGSPGLFSAAGSIIVIGLIVILLGVGLVTAAGFGRERILNRESATVKNRQASGSFMSGLAGAVLAGVLSSGISLAFVYSQGPVIAAIEREGGGALTANFAVWALCMFGGGMVNVVYALYGMAKKNSWKLLFARKAELVYGAIIGMQFIAAIMLMGRGMVLLGMLGASVGFAIQQSMQIIGNQLVGFGGGEWKGVHGRPRRIMWLAITLILLAVLILAYSNTMQR
jgi:L-rhamnose-H+ transport protein